MIRSYLEPPELCGQRLVLEQRRFGDVEVRFYRVPDIDRLLDEMDTNAWRADERMPYWAEVWPSGLALAELLAEGESLRGVRVLELGCGLGLPSIVAAKRGAMVTASDYIPEALELLEINAELNGVDIRRVELDWRRPVDVGRFDLVVAADVLYERWQVEVVVTMLGRTVLPAGRAIVVDPDRETAKGFADAATYRGFRVTRRAYERSTVPIRVYQLVWARAHRRGPPDPSLRSE